MNDDSIIGQQIDTYQIERLLGQGGMASVYLARDLNLDRWVAIKVLPAKLTREKSFIRRFKREARTLAQFRHPNIIQVYSFGLLRSGEPYIVMEYVEGGTLQDWLQQNKHEGRTILPAQILAIMEQVAQALAVMHRNNVVHRDLKPSNILVRPDGTPILADMGIVAVREATHLTRTNQTLGTPHYMSPEQIKGQELDGRSDVYAFGIVLYELLAGRPPFDQSDTVAVIYQQINEAPLPLSDLYPGLTPSTYKVVHTCLRKIPSARYETAEQLAAALKQAVQREMSGKQPPFSPLIDWLAAARTPRYLWGLVALLFLLSSILGLFALATQSSATLTAPEPTSASFVTALTETSQPLASSIVIERAPTTVSTSTIMPKTDATVTPELTTEAPTATEASTKTPLPTLTPIPTPTSCPIAVNGAFVSAWSQHVSILGCPLAVAQVNVWIGQQNYQQGWTFWREDTDLIYAVYADNHWESYANLWQVGDPVYSCGPEENPPTPILGSGKVWCSFPNVRDGLGNATAEAGGKEGIAQDFPGGFMMRIASGKLFVFYNNGTWR